MRLATAAVYVSTAAISACNNLSISLDKYLDKRLSLLLIYFTVVTVYYNELRRFVVARASSVSVLSVIKNEGPRGKKG
jgi:hypothetical protein